MMMTSAENKIDWDHPDAIRRGYEVLEELGQASERLNHATEQLEQLLGSITREGVSSDRE